MVRPSVITGRCVALSALLAIELFSAPAVLAESASTTDAALLIEKMSTALQTLNYEGTFVHLQNGSIDTMLIVHASDEYGELERMLALNGEAREVIRNHSLVTCIWPASQSVVVTKSKPRNLLPTIDASLITNKLYDVSMATADRVAGIATHVVEVMPHDHFRYGYRFWIDQTTHMLLRSALLDSNGKPVEQVIFTAIEYPQHIDSSRFDVAVNDDQVSWREPAVTPVILRQRADRVGFDKLPMGYTKTSETYRAMPINDGPVSHVMLSDGMASVSVYVEYIAEAAQNKGTLGLSSMGAMNAYSLSLPNAYITVVGEVPSATVQAIAEAVRLVQ